MGGLMDGVEGELEGFAPEDEQVDADDAGASLDASVLDGTGTGISTSGMIDGDDGAGVEAVEGMPDTLLADDWSTPANGAAATWKDVPIGFVERYQPTVPSKAFKTADPVAVGYTRESSEDQTENSQPRQIANIRGYAKRSGLRVKTIYSDLGVSGTSTYGRDAFDHLMADARQRKFSIIVFEHLDRFSRSLPDILAAWDELHDLGIEMHDAKQGKLDLAHLVIMGYLGVEGRVRFLDLCKGGKRNAVSKGLVMHAPSYGYRKHPSKRGVHLVVPDRAEVVQQIFKWVAMGVGSTRIAGELDRRGIPSPRQCQALDNAGAPDEAAVGWTAREVREIVNNPIYAGWNIWGRTTPRRDRKTRRVVGYDVRPREDWVVSHVPALAIVSDEAQARAMASLKKRFFGGPVAGANRAGTHLLAGCVRCAVCGSAMHAGTSNMNRLVYFCSSHRGSAVGRCPVKGTVRLDWLEAVVVAEVAARVLRGGDEAAYGARFRAGYEEGQAARLRRVGEIDRAIARIRTDLKASYIAMTRRTGVPPDVIAEVNDGLRTRIDQLAHIRAELDLVPAPEVALATLQTLGGALDMMAAQIPFRPANPEGEALAQTFRRLVGSIAVHPRDADGIVRLELRFDRDRVTAPRGFKVEAASGLTSLMIDTKKMLRRESEGRFQEIYAEMLAAAQSGLYALPDAAWRIAEPLVADVDLVVDGVVVGARDLIEGALLILKTKGALSKAPSKYGDAHAFHKALKRLIYANAWDAVIAAFRREMPSLLVGAELERLNTTSYERAKPKRRVGKLAHWDDEERRKRVAGIDAALALESDELTRRRLQMIRLRLLRTPTAAVVAQFDVTPRLVYQTFSAYRLGGIDGVRGARSDAVKRCEPKHKPKVFSPGAKAVLQKIVEEKVDAGGHPWTFKTLLVRCKEDEELGIECSMQCLRSTLRGMKIDLPFFVEARRQAASGAPLDAEARMPGMQVEAGAKQAPRNPTVVGGAGQPRRGRVPHAKKFAVAPLELGDTATPG